MTSKQALLIGCPVILLALLLFGYYLYACSQVSYTGAKVIDTSDDKIEVQLGEEGPRVFVEDLGEFKPEDIKYGDEVELSFSNREYKVIGVKDDD